MLSYIRLRTTPRKGVFPNQEFTLHVFFQGGPRGLPFLETLKNGSQES